MAVIKLVGFEKVTADEKADKKSKKDKKVEAAPLEG
jgi:hypothetical protein